MVENTFNVAMVGTRGAGKTVFLAAMYKALRQFKPDCGFYLEAERPNAKVLIQAFSRLNSQKKWIDPTAYDELSEWLFTVRVMGSNGRVFSSCAFNYIDYAGGNLTTLMAADAVDRKTMAADKVDRKLQEADCFLALLDGFKLQQLVTEPDGAFAAEFRDIDLPAILDPIRKTPEGKTIRPIQFVISKWDHIRDHIQGENDVILGQIKKALFKIEEFEYFVETVFPKDDVPLRLIPISAVGFEFVDGWDVKEDGQQPEMVIRKGAQAKPWNVEMPISCVLPDIIKGMQIKAIQEQEKAIQEQEEAAAKTYTPERSWWQSLLIGVYDISRVIPIPFVGKAVELILELNAKRILKKEEMSKEEFEAQRAELVARRAELVANLEGEIGAFELTLLCFAELQRNLDIEFPESELS